MFCITSADKSLGFQAGLTQTGQYRLRKLEISDLRSLVIVIFVYRKQRCCSVMQLLHS